MSTKRDTLLRRTAEIRHELKRLEHVESQAFNAANALRHEETSILQQLRAQEQEEVAKYLGAFLPDPSV